MDENAEILQEFIQETREHLAAIEPDLLEMERQAEAVSAEIVNRVFRAIHSTKGGAAFLAFDALKEFSHAMENVLMLIRDGQLKASSNVVDALLRGVDVLRAMLDDVENSDAVPYRAEMERLSAILAMTSPEAPSAHAPAAPAPAAEKARPIAAAAAPAAAAPEVPAVSVAPAVAAPTPAQPVALPPLPPPTSTEDELARYNVALAALAKPLAQGMSIHRIDFGSVGALTRAGGGTERALARLGSVGTVLSPLQHPPQAPPDEQRFEVLCASVLEPGLLAGEAEVAERCVYTFNSAELKQRLKPGTVTSVPMSNIADPSREAKPAEPRGDTTPAEVKETLRVRVDLLNRLMNVAGELVLGRNQLLRSLKDSSDSVAGLNAILQHIDRVTTELQEGIMQTRMQPIGTLFGRYSRVVRDIARQLGKQINLHTEGEDVELDKSIIEALADPLTHLLRNCCDHAIEMPEDRIRSGKSPAGKISLLAFHESGQVNIVVADDGRGISRQRVLAKALEKGIVTQAEAAAMADRDVVKLVLAPGFSTAEAITDISGRGVGMDVVRTNVEKLGGHLEVASEEGVGTTVMLRLPLTLAIIPSLIVRAGDARFAVPQVSIVELVWVRADEVGARIELIHGSPVLRLRGHLLPLVRLSDVLGIKRQYQDPATGAVQRDRRQTIEDRRGAAQEDSAENRRSGADYNVLVLRAGPNRFGIIVDELFESEEIVVKPLPSHLKDIECFAGTTILGDGRVTMILDPGGIAARAKLSFASVAREEERRKAEQERAAAHAGVDSRSVILFNNAPGEVFAVPQERVLRLERISRDDILKLGGRDFVKYRGAGLPVVRLDQLYPVSSVPNDAEEMFLIIPKEHGGTVVRGGILVWRIVDALDVEVSLQRPLFAGPGLLGAALVDGNLTTFLDPGALLDSAEVA
jgi:two-component system chemotaxis sensor kinase CheA